MLALPSLPLLLLFVLNCEASAFCSTPPPYPLLPTPPGHSAVITSNRCRKWVFIHDPRGSYTCPDPGKVYYVCPYRTRLTCPGNSSLQLELLDRDEPCGTAPGCFCRPGWWWDGTQCHPEPCTPPPPPACDSCCPASAPLLQCDSCCPAPAKCLQPACDSCCPAQAPLLQCDSCCPAPAKCLQPACDSCCPAQAPPLQCDSCCPAPAKCLQPACDSCCPAPAKCPHPVCEDQWEEWIPVVKTTAALHTLLADYETAFVFEAKAPDVCRKYKLLALALMEDRSIGFIRFANEEHAGPQQTKTYQRQQLIKKEVPDICALSNTKYAAGIMEALVHANRNSEDE